jgi:hypothetical protein
LFQVIRLPVLLSFLAVLVLYGLGAWILGIIRKSDINQLAQLIGHLTFAKTHAT